LGLESDLLSRQCPQVDAVEWPLHVWPVGQPLSKSHALAVPELYFVSRWLHEAVLFYWSC